MSEKIPRDSSTDEGDDRKAEKGLIESRPLKPGYLISAGVILGLASTRNESLLSFIDLRDALPEPFDVSDHIANTMWTFGAASMAAMGLNRFMKNNENSVSTTFGGSLEFATEAEYKKRRNILVGAVALMSAGLNWYGEAIASNQFDGVDLAYGLIGGAVAYATQKAGFHKPEDAEYLVGQLPDDSDLVKLHEKLNPSKPVPGGEGQTEQTVARKFKKHKKRRR